MFVFTEGGKPGDKPPVAQERTALKQTQFIYDPAQAGAWTRDHRGESGNGQTTTPPIFSDVNNLLEYSNQQVKKKNIGHQQIESHNKSNKAASIGIVPRGTEGCLIWGRWQNK